MSSLSQAISQSEFKLPANTKGVVITSVDDASPAAAAGFNRGDVIQEVNHKPVSTVAEYKAAVAAAGKQPLLLLVNEGGITRYVVVEGQ